MSRYKINIKTLWGKVLNYTVSSYEVTTGDFVEFVDEVTGIPKKFHASNVEIEVINGD